MTGPLPAHPEHQVNTMAQTALPDVEDALVDFEDKAIEEQLHLLEEIEKKLRVALTGHGE
ncbi:hypothetical protein [Schaalia sp. lx-100]|uniref:hypothetical protein n=1 Tax=Schaalia sp. lx-100 TaxID=2899081 RepID=UPI001E3A7D91|nr:hypothetical protein [Schaalia sp. lx-100]MCD4556918.1 hypothetical protein [Schaalia sp. lx-100]